MMKAREGELRVFLANTQEPKKKKGKTVGGGKGEQGQRPWVVVRQGGWVD